MKKRILALAMAALSVALLAACGKTAQPETLPTVIPSDEAVETVPEPESKPPVQISMPDYEMTYSGTLKDVIRYAETEEGLSFTVVLSTGEAPIFTMKHNSDEGDLVAMIDDASGNKVPVAFLMASIPKGLNDADMDLFCTAQESVNDILDSLVLK